MEKKTRGFWTTLVLVLYILGGINSLFTPLTNKNTAQIYPELALSNGMVVFSVILGIIIILISIGIFMWKKMAVYALAVYYPVTFLVNLITIDFSMGPIAIGIIIGGIISIVISYLIVFSLLKKIKYNEEVENTMNV
ncbi:hypothetical protein IO99_04420 [Clostridium sulfidigenes]|uniref:DUF2127 domain-containing protein n=1 Tax=Clostridium sulfidigenes TaxID=318464 RepID=A0A084JFM2_9CLOT|nr:hypothetical protein [Clostridium sulfidigenes]KEZ87756.1 hypothetical protein IO99_04420 [Clostridium sulfidigenes]